MIHETYAVMEVVIRWLTLSERCFVNMHVNVRHYVIT